MPSNLVRRARGEVAPPAKAQKRPYKERKEHGQALTRLDDETQLETRAVGNLGSATRACMKELGRTSACAMEIRLTVTEIERALVAMEPGAINELAQISQQMNIGMLQLLSGFVHEATS